jgi:hypothetical protein
MLLYTTSHYGASGEALVTHKNIGNSNTTKITKKQNPNMTKIKMLNI